MGASIRAATFRSSLRAKGTARAGLASEPKVGDSFTGHARAVDVIYCPPLSTQEAVWLSVVVQAGMWA